jgi:RND family efflux transporter MFP subunit
LLIVLTMAVNLGGCGREPPPPPQPAPKAIETLELDSPFNEYARQFPGRVRAAERVDLAFQVAGSIEALPASEGSRVERGELLARLDQRDFESDVGAARAELERAQADFARAEQLLAEGFVSQAEYDQIKARRDVAASNLATAGKALEETELRAPFAGVVANRYVENFTDVQAKEPVVSLQDVSTLEVVVQVPERLVARIRGEVRADLSATFDAIPDRSFPLTLKEFTTRADPKTQTYEYVLVMPRPADANVLPGMTVRVSVRRPGDLPGKAAMSFLIPAAAVVAGPEGEAHVWVLDPEDNTVHERVVRTGLLTGQDQVEIVDGLALGDVIAVSAAPRLREGMLVRRADADPV